MEPSKLKTLSAGGKAPDNLVFRSFGCSSGSGLGFVLWKMLGSCHGSRQEVPGRG